MSSIHFRTTEMHTQGEPLRIVESGYPEIKGTTILEKRRYCQEHLDHIRRLLMSEPRGHVDMYGAVLVAPDLPDADIGTLFIHNEGYSTMCGHGVIALARYAVDKGIVKNPTFPVTEVNIQCPCGLVRTYVEYQNGKTGNVRFHSVPAFVFASDITVSIGRKIDISYGGAFYAFAKADDFGLNVRTSSPEEFIASARKISNHVKNSVKLYHPESSDLAYLYGVFFTDGQDEADVTRHVCVFADRQIDRSATGSGVTARVALLYHKKILKLKEVKTFESILGTIFTGKAIEETSCGDFPAVIVEVSGKAHYTGTATFTVEDDDPLKEGFLLKENVD